MHVMPNRSVGRGVALASSQDFLDNLENLRLVMSVALDHTQRNLDRFVESATGVEMRRADGSISKIRILAEQLEKEFNALEHTVANVRSKREPGDRKRPTEYKRPAEPKTRQEKDAVNARSARPDSRAIWRSPFPTIHPYRVAI